MKNLSVVFFFLLAFTFSSVAVQAQQATCKPADCKKVCTKTAKADTKKAQTPSFGIVKTSNAASTTIKTKASCKPADCKKVCTKANKTSVTATEAKKTPAQKVVAVKQE